MSSRTADIVDAARRARLPVATLLVQILCNSGPGRHTLRHTLLAVCPNSDAVARAALLAAREADAPLLYAATLNQVDTDGGYTGWTPASFAAFVHAERTRLGHEGPVLLCLDHGGPWKKDLHLAEGWSYAETMAAVKRSVEACLEAGYALLHLDPTVDRERPPGAPVPVEVIVERTVELMAHAEACRLRLGLAPIAYEVGTEEVGGGLRREDRFAAFVRALGGALRERGLPMPTFVVGDVGTTLDTGHFDPEMARCLGEHARGLGALLKAHYTDGVDHPEAYPASGIGGANVGPGFAAEEYATLMELVRLEEQLGRASGLPEALRRCVVASGRWKKWLRAEERGLPFEALAEERQAWLVETGSRYVWTAPEVAQARRRLYEHVRDRLDGEAFVLDRIKSAMLRYFRAFNLVGLNEALAEELGKAAR